MSSGENKQIGVIGGSGFYDFLPDMEDQELITPFGKVTVATGKINDADIYFIPRHGTGHSVPPHLVRYKANIHAFHQLGISKILSTNAVGSIKTGIEPGDFVLLDQFIALYGTETFFDGEFETVLRSGKKTKGVKHVDVTEPYCQAIRQSFVSVIGDKKGFHDRGTYILCKGPRFETRAEIDLYSNFADLAGMTNAHECSLARELEICYGTLCVVTNYAAGIQDRVTHDEVVDLFAKKIGEVKQLFNQAIHDLISKNEPCNCHVD
ncbi:MAG: MTAP family purine nucleoside phosphorylase [Candidatus Hodarchaeales archaeon]|jgi:5'-methylthioadenosine phosphorylase